MTTVFSIPRRFTFLRIQTNPDPAKLKYKPINIQLEYEMIRSRTLAGDFSSPDEVPVVEQSPATAK